MPAAPDSPNPATSGSELTCSKRRRQRRRAPAGLEQRQLRRLLAHEVEDEALGEVLLLGERRDHEALHADEHLRRRRRPRGPGSASPRTGTPVAAKPGVLLGDRPRAGDGERRLALAEALDHHVVGDVGAEQARRRLRRTRNVRRLEAARRVDAEVVGVERAVLVLGEACSRRTPRGSAGSGSRRPPGRPAGRGPSASGRRRAGPCSRWPIWTISSNVAGASGTRSVLRMRAMFSTAYGRPYVWPSYVNASTATSWKLVGDAAEVERLEHAVGRRARRASRGRR